MSGSNHTFLMYLQVLKKQMYVCVNINSLFTFVNWLFVDKLCLVLLKAIQIEHSLGNELTIMGLVHEKNCLVPETDSD